MTMFTAQSVFAASEVYKAKLNQLKASKSAKMKVIRTQEKEIKNQIELLSLNTKISEANRQAKMKSYENKLIELEKKKSAVKKQYKLDKKKIQTYK